jgi:glycosyltransferase involved in cell wall biosynthesis
MLYCLTAPITMKINSSNCNHNKSGVCDVLMIAHNRPEYTALSLPALLESGDETLRVWVWQNGENAEVSKIIDAYTNHDRLYKLYRSPKNLGLRAPTNWLWSESDANYVGKVDDDILMPQGWAHKLKCAHEKVRHFGVLGCWVFPAVDYNEKMAKKKISRYQGEAIVENGWMPGPAYLMKRACVQKAGLLREDDTFPAYSVRLAWAGWIHGWLLPLICCENMDDPRSPRCLLKTQDAFEKYTPLTAAKNNVTTLEGWKSLSERAARGILQSPKKAGRLFWVRRMFRRGVAFLDECKGLRNLES